MKEMSFTLNVSNKLKIVNYDTMIIQNVPCLLTKFNGDIRFELRPCNNQHNILNKCKAWIGSMMAMLSKNSRQQTSRTTLVWGFVVVDV
jgi:hypothetical protein